jgi:transcriptional regulator with XRE-family HTH domain
MLSDLVTRGKRNPLHQGLADRLKKERKLQRLSFRALALRAEVGIGTPQNIEVERNAATLEVVEKLARALGVSPAWLAFGMGPREPPPLHFRRKASELITKLDASPETWCKEAAAMLQASYGVGEADAEEKDEGG